MDPAVITSMYQEATGDLELNVDHFINKMIEDPEFIKKVQDDINTALKNGAYYINQSGNIPIPQETQDQESYQLFTVESLGFTRSNLEARSLKKIKGPGISSPFPYLGQKNSISPIHIEDLKLGKGSKKSGNFHGGGQQGSFSTSFNFLGPHGLKITFSQ